MRAADRPARTPEEAEAQPSAEVARLPNGLRLVVDPAPSLETAALGVWVDAGSRDEASDEHGLCHLLEHMAFKGTPRRSARDIAEAIEGAGGNVNAATSFEQTGYFARVLADDLPQAVDVLADITLHGRMSQRELDSEKSVVLQEIGDTLDVPESLVFDRLQARAFHGQTLGRAILGTPETVKHHTAERLRAFRERVQRADAMVVSIAGRTNMAQMYPLVEAAFGSLQSGTRPPRSPAHFTPGFTHAVDASEQTHLTLAWPGPGGTDPDRFAARVLSEIWGGGMSSRLFQSVREERGLCYGIYSFHDGFADAGLLGCYAATDQASAGEVVRLVRAELQSLAEGPEPKELDRAKAQLKGLLAMSRESLAARAEGAASQLLRLGEVWTTRDLVAAVDAVSAEAVAETARRALASAPAAAVVGPAAAQMEAHIFEPH